VQSAKRRDFRSVKDKPEAPGALRSKKSCPFIILCRYVPEYFEKNKDTYWGISREAKKTNNSWRVFSKYPTAAGAEQALAHQKREDVRWRDLPQYEYKIMDCRK
jgi:nucleoid-associated protein YgaU